MCNRRPIHNRPLFELTGRAAEREALRRLAEWRAEGHSGVKPDAAPERSPYRRRNPGAPWWARDRTGLAIGWVVLGSLFVLALLA